MTKAIAQLVVAILAAVWAALTDNATANAITTQEWMVVISMAVGAAGVYIVPNLAEGMARYAKGVVSFMTAALPVLYTVIPGGLTQAETIEVIVAGAAALGLVVGLKNPGYQWAIKPGVRNNVT
jgi:hypothetical protein